MSRIENLFGSWDAFENELHPDVLFKFAIDEKPIVTRQPCDNMGENNFYSSLFH